jgi:hypothetical protein
MTTKERLACGERILRSIDARRNTTKNSSDLLPLEQAIVDRELLELDSEPIASEKVLMKPDRRRNNCAQFADLRLRRSTCGTIPSSEREQDR